MRRVIITLALVIATLSAYAGKASEVMYKLAPSERQYEVEDDNIIVSYEIYSQYPDGQQKFGPNPYLRVKFTNKTNGKIYIDLGASSVLKNGDATPMFDDGRVISVDPISTITVDDIQLLTPGSETSIPDRIYFKEVGKGKKKQQWCYSCKLDNLNNGDILEFDEESSPFTIGANITYSKTADLQSPKSLKANYYVERIIGLSSGSSSIPLPTSINLIKGAYDAMNNGKTMLKDVKSNDRERGIITIQLWVK